MPDVDKLCSELMPLGRDRRYAIKTVNAYNARVEGYIRQRLGYTAQMPEAERTRLVKIAAATRKAIEGGSAVPSEAGRIVGAVTPWVLSNVLGRAEPETVRANTEREMARLARQLPVWQGWAASVKGFSELGLGVVVSHAHNLSRYPSKSHLWSRLMVGLRDGARQGHVPANLSRAARRDAYIEHAYNPARLGDLYPFLYDALLRAQWRGDRDGVPAHPIGPYGVYYGTKKAEYLARFEGQKGWRTHADMAARRYAAKMFLRDLWTAW